ncbi:sphingosine N-acyltransferase lag1 [Purpureocillium lilacinum]|nr:sphingosine N-acyltransferase lag1 [Purpureocillium lilacinum]
MMPQNLATWFLENQARITFSLLTLLTLSHTFLSWVRPYTSQLVSLSGYNPRTGKYAISSGDLCLVAFLAMLLTGLRAGAIDGVLRPLGRRWGISKQRASIRFAEQAWLVIFSVVSGPIGFWLYRSSSYYLGMEELWTGWPDRELGGLMKGYFLVQLAFWIQQIMVVHIEKRRSDHWQMVVHHVVTVMLVGGSYAYHQTRVGNLIMVLMDTVEVFLSLAKCLKYLGLRTACNATFGTFMAWWFIARHALFLRICWSIYTELPRIIPSACYIGGADDLGGPFPVPDSGWSHLIEPLYKPSGVICWDGTVRWAFLYCLLFLQALLMIWFVLILRAARGLLNGKSVEDERSGDEGTTKPGEGEVVGGSDCMGKRGTAATRRDSGPNHSGRKPRVTSSSGVADS